MEDLETDFMRACGKSARRTLESIADELGLEGDTRNEMLKSNITISGPGFKDVY